MRLLAGFRRGLQSSIAGWFGMDRHSLSDKGQLSMGTIVRLSLTDRNGLSVSPLNTEECLSLRSALCGHFKFNEFGRTASRVLQQH
jgi:hypothetical protein